jgi:hypothetical protein
MTSNRRVKHVILKFTGELEVDTDRGVVYFHDSTTGMTRLRICRLGNMPPDLEQIDITPIRDASLVVGFSRTKEGGLIHRDAVSEEVREDPKTAWEVDEGGEAY